MSTVLKVVGASWLQTKISSYILGFLGVLAILALIVGQFERIQADGNYAATVFHSEKTGYRIEYWGQSNELTDIPKGVARAYFRRDVDTTGWSILEVETDATYPDEIQAYAAGVLEGALTWPLILSHIENTINVKCDGTPQEKMCNKLKDHLDKVADIWKNHASEREDDPFWHQVSLFYTQIKGIYTGWKHGLERGGHEYEIDISDLYWLNSMSEIPELQHTFNLTIDNTTFDNLPDVSSAFLRVVNETTDDGVVKTMYLAHNTAGSYSSMTRILKRYKLYYHLTSTSDELVPGTAMDFPGYPGAVSSHDEFYIIKGRGHRMAVTGTPLRNYNPLLWKEVNITKEVPIGPRVCAANRLSQSGGAWARALAASNSGTACKQWLLLDFTKLHQLTEDTELKYASGDVVTQNTVFNNVRHTVVHHGGGRVRGLLTLVEQAPARTHSRDLSDAVLARGYWATHGLPHFKDIAEQTHTLQMEELHGMMYSESESPRAMLFKQYYKNVTSLDSVIKLMRQINVTDVNKANDACKDDVTCALTQRALSALGVRGDVVPPEQAYGVIDTKVVCGTQNSAMLEFVAISGPPHTAMPKRNLTTLINKGNVAPIYTEQFNNKSHINGLEVRDLVRHKQEEAEQKTRDLDNKDVVKPFQWSKSSFANVSHSELPDKWDFGPYTPKWSW